MIALVIAVAIAVVLVLALARVFLGPTMYDRVLAISIACSHATLIAAALAVVSGRSAWIDVSFGFVACALVLSVVVLKFFRARTFQAPLAGANEAG